MELVPGDYMGCDTYSDTNFVGNTEIPTKITQKRPSLDIQRSYLTLGFKKGPPLRMPIYTQF